MIILIAINDADDDVDIDADIDVDVDADVVGFFDTNVLHLPLTLVGNIELSDFLTPGGYHSPAWHL